MSLTKPKTVVAGIILAIAMFGTAAATRLLGVAGGERARAAASQEAGPAVPAKEAAGRGRGDAGQADVTTIVKRRRAGERQLGEIANALWHYCDNNKGFPAPAISSKDGKPLLSWRVAILPYLEENDLFKRFKLEEPWDSDHNKQLLAEMPKVYAPVVPTKAKSVTYYQALVGEGAAFEPNKRMRLADFRGAIRSTIMVVEAAEAVPWTKPQDLSFAPEQPLPKLGGLFGGHFYAMFGDGLVQFVSKNADPKELRKAIMRNDGQVVDFDKLLAPIIRPSVVDQDLLPVDIKYLEESIADATGEVAKAKQALEALTSKLAKAAKLDAPAGKLFEEHVRLRLALEQARRELDGIRDEIGRLERRLPRKSTP